MKEDTIIYWVQSVGPGDAKERVAMYFKGILTRNSDEGMRGDIRARPQHLGPGEYTATYGGDTFEHENGTPINFGEE